MTIAASVNPALIAFLGVLVGAMVSAVLGPFMVQRAARLETYRSWQVELAEDFLKTIAAVRGALEELRLSPDDKAKKAKTSGLIEDLNVLALRAELVFRRRSGLGTPAAAKTVIEEAENALENALEHPDADPELGLLEKARHTFVEKASDEIRGRSRFLRADRRPTSSA